MVYMNIPILQAADACGIPKSTFRDAALRAEAASGCAETKYIQTE